MKYKIELKQIEEILQGDEKITILSNFIALAYHSFENINWLGFYIYKDNMLKLGPFQGKVACEKIEMDKGVCGYAASNRIVANIKNVHEFPGHIACDSASRSELVVPIVVEERLFGVLDIDSPVFERFDKETEEFFVTAAKKLEEKLIELHSTSLM